MFVELMPLLAGRTVMITVAREDDKTLRVNVIPTTRTGESENPALTTPLSYTGTPEELDAELGRELAGYVECHRALGSTLAAAKAEMDAAAKAAQEEAKKKAEERKKKSEKPTDKPGDPVPSIVPTSPAPAASGDGESLRRLTTRGELGQSGRLWDSNPVRGNLNVTVHLSGLPTTTK